MPTVIIITTKKRLIVYVYIVMVRLQIIHLILLKTILFSSFIGLKGQKVLDVHFSYQIIESNNKAVILLSESAYQGNKENPYRFYSIPGNVEFEMESVKYDKLTDQEKLIITESKDTIPKSLSLFTTNSVTRKKEYTNLYIYPYVFEHGEVKKLSKLSLKVIPGSKSFKKRIGSGVDWKLSSVLSSGDIYKLAITSDGVYTIDRTFINNLGLDPDDIDPSKVLIYSGDQGMIPKNNAYSHYDDLKELNVLLQDDGDSRFESGESIKFFAGGPHTWIVNDQNNYEYSRHLYSDTSYYFIKVNSVETSKGLLDGLTNLIPDSNVTFSDELQIHENEWTNLIKTGNKWVGESFEFDQAQLFTFNVPGFSPNLPAEVHIHTLARATSGINKFGIKINSSSYADIDVPLVSGVYFSDYVKAGAEVYNFQNNSSRVNVELNYSKPQSNSLAWLDFISLKTKRRISFTGGSQLFRLSTSESRTIRYNISGSFEGVWLVNEVDSIVNLPVLSDENGQYVIVGPSLYNKFVVFDNTVKYPSIIGKIRNQNLHGLSSIDYLIIAPDKFEEQAERLAQFHRLTGLTVEVVNPIQIYNEFSSGSQDVMGIRKFLKMLYDRASDESEIPKYLLLFGDGSYDPKNRISNNTNQIVTYQSDNSYEPTLSYVSDDFFVLLDDEEGEWLTSNETVDMGVGRFPVNTVEEAKVLVDKSINYGTVSEDVLGDWRNEIVFVADDEDGNTHMFQSDFLSDQVKELYPNFNSRKIFFDAYPQESGAGGDLYPRVNNEINEAFQNGALIINYTGHGGEIGWAHERVLGFNDIDLWTNKTKLPLVMTATCEFSRYDDPALTSAGEAVLLSGNGGAIALFTTVRLVFSSPNFILNQNFYDNLIDTINFDKRRLGDIYALTKRASGGSTNHRNFTLLGDPALFLSSPKKQVRTTKINGVSVGVNDTIKSLSVVSVEGEVLNSQGEVDESFNGILEPTVFDKPRTVNSLANDGGLSYEFETQENIIFKGNVSVNSGRFQFQFMVPKDISFNEGFGKISYYVSSNTEDGSGNYSEIIVSGTSDSVVVDETGPDISIYLNDQSFVDGGLSDQNPLLLVDLIDSSGINTVGNGIGHDITATINNESSDAVVLNDFYESDLDSYQSGSINYQYLDLPEGDYTLQIKAWDVHNNSSERSISFRVVDRESLEISNVFNYPNPFTTNTSFLFDVNQVNESLDIEIHVMTISGRVVKTLHNTYVSNSFKGEQISWDGKDDFGSDLARGVYLYKLTVSNSTGESVNHIEKLVVLK